MTPASPQAAPTPFQQRVYDALLKIPRGQVTTYGLLARYLRCKSAQAVGQALRRNPFAPRVPCHRVIASSLQIGGYVGDRTGPEIIRKQKLLAREGVGFVNGTLRDPSKKLFKF
jgi:methylated-DNA-[protein]-cysteine S-methyltransferase